MCNFTVPVRIIARQRFLNPNMVLKDQQQLRKIRRGDIASFEMLFHRYHPGMCRYAESLVRHPGVAEELVQDVFYNLWKNRETLRINKSWQGYLYRSVYNNAMMYLRKAHRERPMDEQLGRLAEVPGPDPSDQMEFDEVTDMVWKTLEELPERTREIFRLNRQEGMKYREIAVTLSISVKTVEAHMGKALRALRTTLQKYEQE